MYIPCAGTRENKGNTLVHSGQQSIEVATNPFRRFEVTVSDMYGRSEYGCKIDVNEVLLFKQSRYAFEVGLVSRVCRVDGGGRCGEGDSMQRQARLYVCLLGWYEIGSEREAKVGKVWVYSRTSQNDTIVFLNFLQFLLTSKVCYFDKLTAM